MKISRRMLAGSLLSLVIASCAPMRQMSIDQTKTLPLMHEALAENGEAKFTIVHSGNLAPSEKFAMKELVEHLNKVTGADFQMREEKSKESAKNAIYLGRTEFAKRNGVDFTTFGEEEWLLKSVKGNLIIGGGKARGTLYGVYDFLENAVGCHWLAFDCTVIPKISTLRIPELNRRRKPALAARDIYRAFHMRLPRSEIFMKSKLFEVRNRNNCASGYFAKSRSKYWLVSLQQRKIYKKMGGAHTFYAYVPPEKYFKTHPEYFPMSAQGVRFCKPNSQLCLSNPDVWRITVETLCEFIKADREKYKNNPDAMRYVYDISQMDGCTFICKCPKCQAFSAKEGGEGALVVNYLNHVATAIEKKYPDVLLRTFAYVSTDVPPKTLKVHDNVIIQFCDLYGKSDCYRPLTHPFNKKQLDLIKGWRKIAKHVMIWDYWNMSAPGTRRPIPEVLVDSIEGDFKTFSDDGLLGCFIEAEEVGCRSQSFMDLQYYLGYQMMLDPNRSIEPLIDIFIKNYYGKAAPVMRGYFDFLRRKVRENPDPMFYVPPYHRAYLTGEFLLKCADYLKRAREAVPSDHSVQNRLDREEVTVLGSMIAYFNQFKGVLEATGITRKGLLEKYLEVRKNMIKAWCAPKAKKALEKEMAELTFSLPLPKKFAGVNENKIKDFAWLVFSGNPRAGKIVDDKDSEAGKAYKLSGGQGDPNFFRKTPVFGLYDQSTKTWGKSFKIKPIPQDEKYHWYRLKYFDFLPSTILWGHYSWWMNVNLNNVYISPDGLPASVNRWIPWISVKLTGSSFVKGSKQKDAIYLDRVILTKPDVEVK